MIKAHIDDKKNKLKVVLKGEGLDLVNESIIVFSSIIADVLNRVYKSDLNQMLQESDQILEYMKKNIVQRLTEKVAEKEEV